MKINELLGKFGIFTTNEEADLLKKLKEPVKLSSLSDHDQFRVEGMIRKSLVTKYGFEDPTIVANENTF
jgi:hypothetical protein